MNNDDRAKFEALFRKPDFVLWDAAEGEYTVKDGWENSYAGERYCAQWIGFRAALASAQAVSADPVAPGMQIDLDDEATKLLLDYANATDEPNALSLSVGHGHSGYGLYMWETECANEGAVLLQAIERPMVDIVPPATSRDRWMYEQGRLAERDPRTTPAPAVAPAAVTDEQTPEFRERVLEIAHQLRSGDPNRPTQREAAALIEDWYLATRTPEPAAVTEADEAGGMVCRPNGLMFDAFGEPRTRYVRVTLDGSNCVMHPSEGDTYLKDARESGDESPYVVADVWLSEREFDDLGEFNGF